MTLEGVLVCGALRGSVHVHHITGMVHPQFSQNTDHGIPPSPGVPDSATFQGPCIDRSRHFSRIWSPQCLTYDARARAERVFTLIHILTGVVHPTASLADIRELISPSMSHLASSCAGTGCRSSNATRPAYRP